MNEQQRQRAWAEFRFAVIAPLVCRRLDEFERRSLKRQILSRRYLTPDGVEKVIADRTLRTWIARHHLYGFDGLLRMRSNTGGNYRAISKEILDEAVKLRLERRGRSARLILSLLRAKGFQVDGISKTTLNVHLNRLGATKEKYASEKGTFQRFQKDHANDLWQSDVSDGIWLPDPANRNLTKKTKVISFIDDATRVVAHAEFYWDEQLPTFIDTFRKALMSRGKPGILFVDNGPVYRSKALAQASSRLGMELIHAQEYCPEGKGKIERHFRTLKEGFCQEAKHAGLATLEDLNRFFFAWLEQEYHNQQHEELKMTPFERWAEDEEKGLLEGKTVLPEDIRKALMIREERKVNTRTGTVRLNNRTYQTAAELAGKVVEVCFEADKKVTDVEIWYDGKFIDVAQEIIPGSHIDYSKRPERPREPNSKAVVLESSKQYRRALESAYRPKEQYSRGDDYLSEPEFEAMVARILERELTPDERMYLSGIYPRLTPLRKSTTEGKLQLAVNVKGSKLHLRSYCELLKKH